MRQRLGIARALVNEPRVVFLDEPTLGLDPAGQRQMLDVVRRIASERGATVLLSTHLLAEVEETCSRVLDPQPRPCGGGGNGLRDRAPGGRAAQRPAPRRRPSTSSGRSRLSHARRASSERRGADGTAGLLTVTLDRRTRAARS